MGLEVVKSSTPKLIREKLKSSVSLILNGTEEDIQNFVEGVKTEFKSMSVNEIAFPRGVKNLNKYRDKQGSDIYVKGTPIHVKGALIFNSLLQKKRLNKIPPIQDGDKIRFAYLKEPNPIHESVIACLDELPKEFGLDKYIDHEKQFDKAFLEPLKSITEVIDWQTEKISSLEEFFA